MPDAPLVYRKWANVLAGLSHIPKQRSEGVKYEFRGIDAVMQHLHPLLAQEGLTLSPRVLDDWQLNAIPGSNNRTQYQAAFRIEVDVWAEDGSCITLGPGMAQSHDYGDKAVYQAQQNAVKYVLLEALCVPVGEPDMDAREADPSPARTFAHPTAEAQTALVDQLGAASIDEVQTKELCLLLSGGEHSTVAELEPQVFYALRNVAGWIGTDKMQTAYTADGVLELRKPDGTAVDAAKIVEAVQP